MSAHPHPDNNSVYHEETPDGHAATTEEDAPYNLDRSTLPRPFALIAAPELDDPVEDDHNDDHDGTHDGDDRQGAKDAPCVPYTISPEELWDEPVIMWGHEHETATATHGRDPETGHWVFGTFDSAEAARAHYSRWGTLLLAYA